MIKGFLFTVFCLIFWPVVLYLIILVAKQSDNRGGPDYGVLFPMMIIFVVAVGIFIFVYAMSYPEEYDDYVARYEAWQQVQEYSRIEREREKMEKDVEFEKLVEKIKREKL